MSLWKLFVGVAVCLAVHAGAFAHGNLWYDWNIDFKPLKKIVVYPFATAEAPDDFLDGAEGSVSFAENNRLWERLNKKLKGHNFLRLSKGPFEEGRVLSGDYTRLLAPYGSEAERARAVEDATMADAYLLPRFRENWVRIDISPETYFRVTLKSWTEETGGPDGDRRYDEQSRTVGHVVPEREMPCRIMDIEYELLSGTGERIVTYENSARQYFTGEQDMFKDLSEEFLDDLKRVKQGKFKPKERKAALRVGFGEISAPTLEGDGERLGALIFAMRDEAKRLDDVRLVYTADSALPPRYLVAGEVLRYELRPTWVAPSVSISTNLESSREEKWYDRKGKEHKKKIKRYTQSVNNHFGHYVYTAVAEANLYLLDARTGATVLTYRGYDEDDKEIDACRHIMRDFYKKANKFLKERGKTSGELTIFD